MQRRDAKTRPDLSPAIRMGLIGGVITLLMCLIGIVEASTGRAVIYPFLSLGQTLLLMAYVLTCASAIRRTEAASEGGLSRLWVIASGALAGLLVSAFLAALVIIGNWIDLRAVFIRASPELYALLSFGLPLVPGVVARLLAGLALGALVAAAYLLPER